MTEPLPNDPIKSSQSLEGSKWSFERSCSRQPWLPRWRCPPRRQPACVCFRSRRRLRGATRRFGRQCHQLGAVRSPSTTRAGHRTRRGCIRSDRLAAESAGRGWSGQEQRRAAGRSSSPAGQLEPYRHRSSSV